VTKRTKTNRPPLLLTRRVVRHPHDPPPALALERELRLREIFGQWITSGNSRLPITPREN
jgi:hypothetical protein